MKATQSNRFLLISRTLLGATLAAMSLSSLHAQTTGSWNTDGTTTTALNWNTTASWTGLNGGLVPNAIGAAPSFTFNITGARAITLNGDKIVGTLNIDDPTTAFFAYTLSAGTPSTSQLIFDVDSGSAALNTPNVSNTVTNTISAGITLNDPLVITTTRTSVSGGGITLSGIITDGASSHSITKNGNGAMTMSNANLYDGGTTINAGRINASNVTAFGTGIVEVKSGGQAYVTNAGTYANNFEIEGIGLTETAGNLGAIRLQGCTLNGTITLTGNARITAFGNTGTLTGNIGETGGSQSLELSNYSTTANSTMTVNGDNDYTGGSTVKGAIVIANNNNAFGTGPVAIQSNGTATRVTRVQLGTDVVIDNDIIINTNAETGFRGAIHSYSGNLATPSLAIVNGEIEIQGPVGNGGHLAAEASSLSVLRVMGPINVTNSSITPQVRVGTVELGGGGNYTQFNHAEGILRLAAANGLSIDAVVNLGLSGISEFDLNSFSQTLAGLTKGPNAATVINNGASASTLTLDMENSSTYAGVFAAGTSNINLVKTGAGTLTLSGNSIDVNGSLSVTGGGLNLTGSIGTSAFPSSMGTGTMLSGEGTFGGDLTFSGTTLEVNGSTSLALFASGNLNTTGGVSVALTSLPSNNDPMEVIGFGGIHTGSVANFTLLNSGNYRNPLFQVNLNNVTLTFDAPADLTWTGVGGNTWDVNTTSNWVDGIPAASKFYVKDNVIFNAGGGTVLVPNSVSATNMSIDGADNWLFQGAGTIEASTLTKSGAGSANIETPWLFGGPITLTAGSLQFSPAVSTTGTLTTSISGAGTLIKGGDGVLSVSGDSIDFTGATVISKGELTMGTTTSLGSTPNITMGNADTLVTDITRLTLPTSGAITSPVIQVAATSLDSRVLSTGGTMSNATITKRGTGKLTIGHATTLANTTNFITGTSSITIEAGTLAGSSVTPISASTTITMGNSSTGTAPTIVELPANQTVNNDVVTLACPLVLSPDAPNSEAILRYPGGTSSGSLSFSGAITLNGRDIYLENPSNTNGPNRLYNVTGKVSGNGNVRVRGGVTGTGEPGTTIRLTNATNDFNGDVYVQTGRLQIGFTATSSYIPDNSLVIMSAGTAFSQGHSSETIRGLVGGASTESVAVSARVDNGSGTANTMRLTVSDSNAANTHVFNGRIINSTGPMALTKAGAATQVLNGVNAYTGTTIITGGTLEIGGAGQLNSGTYSSAITLTSPGTLKFNSTADQRLQTGVISSTGDLVKDNSGELTLAAANTFSGNITVSGGKLIGEGATNSPGVTVFGSRTNTRTITINDGGTLQFNSGNILGSGHTAITAPTLVINSGGVVTNGGIATNNALNNVELNGGTLTSTTGHTSSSEPFAPVYGAWNLNGSVTSTGISTISTSDPSKGWIMLKVPGDKTTDFNVISGTLTVSAPVVDNPTDSNIGSLSKSGAGAMILSGINTYSGNTTVSGGSLELADNAQLKFVLGATTGVNNSITGAGTVTLNGDFVIDTTAADALASGSWTLENVTSLTGAYGSTFTVVGFTDAGSNKWTKANGAKTYTFDETTGVLTLTPAPGYAAWAAINAIGSAANLDKDGDGVANAIEYVLGGDVNTNDLSKLPKGTVVGTNVIFTFLRDVNTIDSAAVTIEVGTTLAAWPASFTVGEDTAGSTAGVVVTEDSSPGFDTITLTVPMGADPKKFARLKVMVTE